MRGARTNTIVTCSTPSAGSKDESAVCLAGIGSEHIGLSVVDAYTATATAQAIADISYLCRMDRRPSAEHAYGFTAQFIESGVGDERRQTEVVLRKANLAIDRCAASIKCEGCRPTTIQNGLGTINVNAIVGLAQITIYRLIWSVSLNGA